jgi:Fur family ferric uptake transcriptional regulator/Fur family zinc uptake transcriptional regulator
MMGSSQTKKAAVSLLRGVSLRVTPVRVLVLGHLLKMKRPVSHAELWRRKRIRSFNRVTVYRTLLTLQSRGIVHAVQGTDGVWRYCAHSPRQEHCPGNHPHFVCTLCGRMSCLPGQTMPHVSVPEGTVVEAKQYVVYGMCSECAETNEQRGG